MLAVDHIKHVLGPPSQINMSHLPNMPYINAFIQECNRFYTLLPLIFHQTSEDAKLCGFFIPKKTGVSSIAMNDLKSTIILVSSPVLLKHNPHDLFNVVHTTCNTFRCWLTYGLFTMTRITLKNHINLIPSVLLMKGETLWVLNMWSPLILEEENVWEND